MHTLLSFLTAGNIRLTAKNAISLSEHTVADKLVGDR